MTDGTTPRVLLVTGAMAAGKSTIAQGIAERLERAVHVRGDAFRRMVVSGRAEPDPGPDGVLSAEATAQLHLRYRLSAQVADEYAKAGFTAIAQDIVIGPALADYVGYVTTRPFGVVVLAPRPEVIAAREEARGKTGYGEWAITELDNELREHTPRIGLWLDTSEQAPADTVDEVLRRLPETLVD